MNFFNRRFALSAAALGLTLTLGAAPALAATHHRHHATHHAHAARMSPVRAAQTHLAHLGYYNGRIDGKMGAQTKAALKTFQHEHSIKPNGVLTANTARALAKADPKVLGTHSFATHDTVTSADLSPGAGHAVSPDFSNTLGNGTKVVDSRFARVDVSESGSGGSRRYNVNLNGQPILVADGQPSVIGISQTYDLGDEDAVIFTTFGPNETGCIYRSHVLALGNGGTKLLDLDSCTRDYNAFAKNGTLFITFPQHDSNSAVGSTWRLEGMNLTKL